MEKLVILIHEVYGVTENLLQLSGLLSSRGFTVLCPAFYPDGYVGSDEQESYNRYFIDVGLERAARTVEELIGEHAGKEISLVGFSVGATVAWMLSQDTRLHRIIGIYGSRIRKHLEIEPAVDTRLFFVEEKSFDVAGLVKALSVKKKVTTAMLKGEHGFYTRKPWMDSLLQELNKTLLTELG